MFQQSHQASHNQYKSHPGHGSKVWHLHAPTHEQKASVIYFVVRVNIAIDLSLSLFSLYCPQTGSILYTKSNLAGLPRQNCLGPKKTQDFGLITQVGQLNLSISFKNHVRCPHNIFSSTSWVNHYTSTLGHFYYFVLVEL